MNKKLLRVATNKFQFLVQKKNQDKTFQNLIRKLQISVTNLIAIDNENRIMDHKAVVNCKIKRHRRSLGHVLRAD